MKIPVLLTYFDTELKQHTLKAYVSAPNLKKDQSLAIVEVEDPKELEKIYDSFLNTDVPVLVKRGEIEVSVGLSLEREDLFINKRDYARLSAL